MPGVLAPCPPVTGALVVDNNSTDGTAEVAADAELRWSSRPQPGYGAAVHAGIVAATTPIVAVLDGDGSLDPRELPGLVEELDRGADMAVGRRRPLPGRALAVACAPGYRGGVLAAAHPARHRGARHRADAGGAT